MSTHSSGPTHTRSPAAKSETPPSSTILLVEDEYAVREFVCAVLKQAGYNVVAAGDGDQGFVEFVADPGKYALVLSDVIMPNRTGPELRELIRQIRPDVPFIFMSAYTGETPFELLNGVTLLEKPFNLDQLLHAVTQAVPRPASRNSTG